ncbi:thioredoxin family protein [Marinilabilia salmonicolor]|uniref:thioredoxin family protein n=1 Tax=Marinilabilia salmonicolor TaxID=989 RepID=UPI00029AE7DA|nr:thioredoxin family protein [Marinilabilia salmonicolor]
MNTISSIDHFNEVVKEEAAILVYFSHEQCNVCKVLKPKVQSLLEEKFPQMAMYYSDTVNQAEVAAQNRVFAVPTVLVFFDGRETYRFSRNIGLGELEQSIQRPYSMIFE